VLVYGDLPRSTRARREARVGDQEIQLAPKEFDLLWELLDSRCLVSREISCSSGCGLHIAGDTRTVDVHVRQLRRKLGDAVADRHRLGRGLQGEPGRDAATADAE